MQIFCPAGKFGFHFGDRPSGDPLGGATPSRMDCGHGALARVDDQNRDAVGGFDGNQPPGVLIDQRIAIAQAPERPAASTTMPE